MAQANELPAKLQFASQYAVLNSDTSVFLNAHRLDLSKVVKNVHKHELKFVATNKKGEEKDLSRGKQNDVHRELRQKLQWELCMQMISNNSQFFRLENPKDQYKFVYDRGINFYSVDQLFPRIDSSSRKEFELTKDGLPEELLAYLGSMGNIRGRLLYVEILDLHQPAVTDEGNRVVAQFYDILTNQMPFLKGTHYVFPSKMFVKQSKIALQGVPQVLKVGMSKNIRFVGNSLQDARTVLQIDAKKAAFFPDLELHFFVRDFLGVRQPREIWNFGNLKRTEAQLKGLVVVTTHMRTNRNFEIKGLTDKSSADKTFEQNGNVISVADYFKIQYQKILMCPELPCAIERRGQQESYYPLEVLTILPGQRVSLQKQTPKLTEQMIRNCQAMPAALRDNTQRQLEEATLVNSNQYFKSVNVRIGELIGEKARVMIPPAIAYNDNEANRTEPNDRGEFFPRWQLDARDNRKFIRPCTISADSWAAVIVTAGVAGSDCMSFLSAFVRNAHYRGIDLHMTPYLENLHDLQPDSFHQMFKYFAGKKVRFVMFFSVDKNDVPTHHMFKVMEAHYKIVTQHVTSNIVLKAIGTKGSQMVLDNILQKFNLKNGGFNHGLYSSQLFIRQSRISADIMAKQWFGPQRMFFGFDMSHAGPQTLYERQAAQTGERGAKQLDPTVVGMAYTISSKVVDMRGTFWMQEARQTTIRHAANHIALALKNFASNNNGAFPREIFVFRGGVSEGGYVSVANDEVQEFNKAFELLEAKGNFRRPSIIIVICQRASNYRVVPARIDAAQKASQQNCQPGTVVDQNVMHPNLTEFLLVGHVTIQGTGQPVRCTVVYDDNPQRIPLQELEYITFSLCYAHGIVTSSVSVPAHLYAASDLAKRGRNNFKMRDDFDSEIRMKREGQSDDDYHISLSDMFSPAGLNSKFWA